MKPTSKEVINELCKILDATPKEIKGFITPQEKAKELVVKYYEEFIKDYQVLACMPDEIRNSIYKKREKFAKKCALIAVHELIEQCWDYREIDLEKSCDYWKEVKEQIYKL